MPARAKVSIEAIKAALQARNGNVSAVAVDVGIARGSLCKRLEVAGINANDYRPSPPADGGPRPYATSVKLMQPTHEALRQAAIDLAYLRRQEYTVASALEEFVGEALASWLTSKKAAKR